MRTPFVAAVGALVVTAGAFAVGHQTVPTATRPSAIRLVHGVPVGVLDTPAGAIAAADNYVASEDDALPPPPIETRAVVDIEWAPQERAVELAQPFPAAALAGKPATVAGLKLTALVAADKLESYSPQSAEVGVWSEITVWSPTVEPAQHWSLETVILAWESGRVAGHVTIGGARLGDAGAGMDERHDAGSHQRGVRRSARRDGGSVLRRGGTVSVAVGQGVYTPRRVGGLPPAAAAAATIVLLGLAAFLSRTDARHRHQDRPSRS